jgi:hypothetical protein
VDLNKLKAIAGDLKKNQEDRKKNSGGGDWPKATFLPDGTHKGRFIFDPNEEIYTKYESIGYFANGLRNPENYKEQWPEGFYNEIPDLSKELTGEYKIWKYGMKTNFLVYFYLLETDAKSENWQPGTLYAIIGNWKFEDAFTDLLTNMVSDAPEKILTSLDPSKPGPVFQITSQGGNQGKCNISATFKESPEISMEGQGYKSLDVAYIRPGFDLEKYTKMVKAMREELARCKQRRADAGSSEKKEETKDEPKAQESSSQAQSESTQQEQSSTDVKQEEAKSENVAEQAQSTSTAESTDENPFARFKR